jgi:hypothetical protein
MPPNELELTLRPRSEACRATTRILEGMYFEFFFLYPEGKNKPENLSDTIAAQFGTEWQHYRVVVDDVEFMFSCYHGESDYRLDEISLYTNPELWARAEIVVPATVARDSFFEFAIAEEELDVISLRAELEVACDVEKRRILFEFAPGEPEAAWTRIAEGALISQTGSSHLKSILFEEVEF